MFIQIEEQTSKTYFGISLILRPNHYIIVRMQSEAKGEQAVVGSGLYEEESLVKKQADSQRMQLQVNKDESANASRSGSILLQNSWLYTLAKLNKINCRQLLSWVAHLQFSLNNPGYVSNQPIFKCQFQQIKTKSAYYCLILPSNSCFAVIKLRDCQGSIVYFRLVPSQSLSQEIHHLQTLIGLGNTLLIDDQTGVENTLQAVIEGKPNQSLVFIHPYRHSTRVVDESRGYCYLKVKESMVYFCKKSIKKLPAFEDIIDNFISFEQRDRNCLLSLLGSNFLHYDSQCFLLHILRNIEEYSSDCSIQRVLEHIQSGKSDLQQLIVLFKSYKHQHLPIKALGRQLCRMCKKKRTNAQCGACNQITGVTTSLCLGKCYINYHELNQTLLQDLSDKVSHNLDYYDSRVEEISKVMKIMVEKGEQQELLLQYIRWSSANIIKRFNSVARKKVGIE